MVFELHGSSFSTCTRRVLAAVAQMGLIDTPAFKLVNHELMDIRKPEWFEHQPFGQMPYLVDTETGLEVFESRAIIRYIAAKTGSPLLPPSSDFAAYAKFEQAASIELANFDSPALALAYELVFNLKFGGTTNPEIVEKNKATLAKRLLGYEAILSKQAYLAGDKLTIADLFHLPYGAMAEDLGVAPGLTDGSLPHVKKWWEGLRDSEAWTRANADLKK